MWPNYKSSQRNKATKKKQGGGIGQNSEKEGVGNIGGLHKIGD